MSRDAEGVPGAWSAVRTLAGVTLTRLGRGKALWIGAAIAAVQVAYAAAVRNRADLAAADKLFPVSLVVLAVLPAMFVGASIGQDIEDRTSAYLWSRPIARWAVIAGKLAALAPLVAAMLVAAWIAAVWIGTGAAPSAASCLGLAAGAIAASMIAAGIAAMLPRQGMPLTIGYLLVDVFIGALPFTLREISITHHVTELCGLSDEPATVAAPLLGLAIIAGLWLALGLARIRRLEV